MGITVLSSAAKVDDIDYLPIRDIVFMGPQPRGRCLVKV